MRTRASLIAGAMALAICLVCPLVDAFDQWDHVLQTGHDTEYPLVVLALCVGAAFVLARLIVRLSPNLLVSSVRYALQSCLNSFLSLITPATLALASISPRLASVSRTSPKIAKETLFSPLAVGCSQTDANAPLEA